MNNDFFERVDREYKFQKEQADPTPVLESVKSAVVRELCRVCRAEKLKRGVMCTRASYPFNAVFNCQTSINMVAAIDEAIRKGGNK